MGEIKKLKEITLKDLKPYEKNAKIHGDYQIDLLKKSIQEFGFVSPILIDENYNVIAGHGRIKAAEELGITKVPCIFIEGLTEDQRKAYILADNKLTELGDWDLDIVNEELEALKNANFDVSITGFDFNDEDFESTDFEGAEAEELVQEVGSLEEQYLVPPLSYLDPIQEYFENREKKWGLLIPPLSTLETQLGYWQKHKKAWNEKGLNSNKGRDGFTFEGGEKQ